MSHERTHSELEEEIRDLRLENERLKEEIHELDKEIARMTQEHALAPTQNTGSFLRKR